MGASLYGATGNQGGNTAVGIPPDLDCTAQKSLRRRGKHFKALTASLSPSSNRTTLQRKCPYLVHSTDHGYDGPSAMRWVTLNRQAFNSSLSPAGMFKAAQGPCLVPIVGVCCRLHQHLGTSRSLLRRLCQAFEAWKPCNNAVGVGAEQWTFLTLSTEVF